MLSSLPPELIIEILRLLPIRSLLAYGLTSKNSYALQQVSLSRLVLDVFHARACGTAGLTGATANRACYNVQIILPERQSLSRESIIRNQNAQTRKILEKHGQYLQDLELALWELWEPTARVLSGLQNLRHLSIRLDHPYTRHTAIDRHFWKTSPGSTVWNTLAPNSGRSGVLGRLQTMSLERSGVTDYQLREILKGNPDIKELRLRKCFTLTDETFKFLAGNKLGQRLVVFHFTMHDGGNIDERVLRFIGKLSKLKSLSLHGCYNISSALVRQMNDDSWNISDLTLPTTFLDPRHGVEIDPG